jgi:hypothetical protein
VTEFQRSIDRQLPSLGFDIDQRSVSRVRRLLAANHGRRLRLPHVYSLAAGRGLRESMRFVYKHGTAVLMDFELFVLPKK